MRFVFFTCLLAVTRAFPFTGGNLNDCPNIPEQDDINLQQVLGSWRLAYLFLDNPEQNLDEESTCAVAELTQVNTTHLNLALFMDTVQSDHVDRSTADLDVLLLSNGEWAVHTPLANDEFLHATVIALSKDHIVLSFCGTQLLNQMEEDSSIGNVASRNDDFDSRGNNDFEIRDNDFESRAIRGIEFASRKQRYRRNLSDSRFNSDGHLDLNDFHGKVRRYIEDNKNEKVERHLWTAILVKDNNVSALRFVEYASLLMKHGYDVTKGELISFGRCDVIRKK